MSHLAETKGIGGVFGNGSTAFWLALLLTTILTVVTFQVGVVHVVEQWQREEYSYGYIVPPITALLVWARLRNAPEFPSGGSWFGVALVALSIAVALLAQVGGMPSGVYYAFLVALWGLFLSALGWRGTWYVTPALAYLLFALPLPSVLFVEVSTTLQAISTRWSVDLMRSLGVIVLRDGNIIDLGIYQLQVAEACSGLGYLFPLSSFAYLLAYLYNGGWLARIVIMVATVPITIVINVFRITLTGVLVDHQGIEAAEGFMHAFEGYVIFCVGVVMFIGLIWIIGRLRRVKGSLLQLFRFELMWPSGGLERQKFALAPSLLASSVFMAVAGIASATLPSFSLQPPPRDSLASFPLIVDEWRGTEGRIGQEFLDILQLDDYLLAEYRDVSQPLGVNLYIAYYEAQNERASIHSPQVCIPAGGWEITDLDTHGLADVATQSGSLNVNRLVIGKGLDRQLVYYWFELRGRQMTDEYAIKLTNLWDAFTRRRTDGALVRVMTPIGRGEEISLADQRLEAFIRTTYPEFEAFIPG